MAVDPDDYPWSSYQRNGLGAGDELVAEHVEPLLEVVGGLV